jgi:hypothetical protein
MTVASHVLQVAEVGGALSSAYFCCTDDVSRPHILQRKLELRVARRYAAVRVFVRHEEVRHQ